MSRRQEGAGSSPDDDIACMQLGLEGTAASATPAAAATPAASAKLKTILRENIKCHQLADRLLQPRH